MKMDPKFTFTILAILAVCVDCLADPGPPPPQTPPGPPGFPIDSNVLYLVIAALIYGAFKFYKQSQMMRKNA